MVPSPLTPGSEAGLSSRERHLGRVWSWGPRRDGRRSRVHGSSGVTWARDPGSNQTPAFKMRKPNSQRESDFFQITDTGGIQEQAANPPTHQPTVTAAAPAHPSPALSRQHVRSQVLLTQVLPAGPRASPSPLPHPGITPAPTGAWRHPCEFRSQHAHSPGTGVCRQTAPRTRPCGCGVHDFPALPRTAAHRLCPMNTNTTRR